MVDAPARPVNWTALLVSGWRGPCEPTATMFDRGFTEGVLHWAVCHAPEEVPALLAAGAPAQGRAGQSLTPLFLALASQVPESDMAVQALLDVLPGPGPTANLDLCQAARTHPHVVHTLLQQGWPAHARDNGDWSALMRAAASTHSRSSEAVAALLDAGCDPMEPNLYGLTAMKVATPLNQTQIQAWLLRQDLQDIVGEATTSRRKTGRL